MVRRTYRYRLYPSRVQQKKLDETLARLRELYNAALQERRDAYQKAGLTRTAYAQMKELPAVREARPEYAQIHTHLLQDALTRLDRAFAAFFRRVKSGEKPGYPRFKGRGRYRTFTFKDAANGNGAKVLGDGGTRGRRVRLSGIGVVKVRLHRPILGTIKQVSVTCESDGHWYVSFSCEGVPAEPLPATEQSVGIDVGLLTFAALSSGEKIENPRHRQRAQKKLRRAQRRVARRKRGSERRHKARRLVARQHAKVRRARLDHHHKVARKLVERFDRIAVEDLNVKGLASGMLAGAVNDAAWGEFTSILSHKAESAGRELVKVDPRGTSQECAKCGARVPKDLSERVHRCTNPTCGYTADRDVNAAQVIELRAFGQRVESSKGSRSELSELGTQARIRSGLLCETSSGDTPAPHSGPAGLSGAKRRADVVGRDAGGVGTQLSLFAEQQPSIVRKNSRLGRSLRGASGYGGVEPRSPGHSR